MSTKTTAAILLTALLATALGYWLGGGRQPTGAAPAITAPQANATAAGAVTERRVLYYRHPMGLNDTSPVPKKDSMGMDYVPVYAEDRPATPGAVTLSPEKIQAIGVRTEIATRRGLGQQILTAGTIAIAESRQRTVAARVEGWVDRLYVNTTGASVHAGQTLADIYSPEIVATEEEYLIAAKAADAAGSAPNSDATSMRDLAQSALTRLRNWGVSPAALERLQHTGSAARTLSLSAPISGVVTEKPAVAGMRFAAGDVLFRLVDQSVVWALADVAEQDLPRLKQGQSASFETAAQPGRQFAGRISFIAPTVDATRRTTQARIELANRDGALRPGMFGRLTLQSNANEVPRLSVSAGAVIDSGTRQIVLRALPGGRFEPRRVQIGLRGSEFVEVLSGLQEGEAVVSAANFLIDAESNLRGALGGMTSPAPAAAAPDVH